ncbi:hypothetical protein [Paenibacillus pini]|uniref:Uncharacterized protein n=1 Tax=Paenibacillus pini JCM 16418 TaxID=1236976 RepID=W7YQT1_9BACL|nr:hypothetical protein [Paenibacillus pini]GAF10912.1 hypothetical protein JCM16418_5147 [Paenibacillus pini JCM 16418]
MKIKTFDNGLVVKHRKSAIIFENFDGKKERDDRFSYEFTKEGFEDFTTYIEEIANEAWSSIVPKEAISMGSDYAEYYDRKYDDNGNLSIKENGILVVAPYWSIDTLYQFNKPKIESFIYDLRIKIGC